MSPMTSNMVALGTKAPQFRLPDPQGKYVSSEDFLGAPALLVAFICNHCPYVKHVRPAFATLAKEYQARGVAVVAISSNDVVNFPDDSPEKMAEEIKLAGYTFPYLYDESQKIAKDFGANYTPEFFVLDKNRKIAYMGAMDDTSNEANAKTNFLEPAVEAALKGEKAAKGETLARGCMIRFKKTRD